MSDGIDHLIINSPFAEPGEHWAYEREAKCFVRREGRRPVGCVIATPGIDSQKYDDPGQFIELPLVNRIRSLEVKGQDSQQDRAKRGYLAEWTEAVNEHAGFGRWAADVSPSPSDLPDILARHARA